MKTSVVNVTILLACGVPLASALRTVTSDYDVISDTVLDVGGAIFNGNVQIEEDKFLALVSGTTEYFNKDLIVDGALYIGSKIQTLGLDVKVLGSTQKIQNTGTIVLNGHNTTLPSTYYWVGESFKNDGEIYWIAQSSLIGSLYEIIPSSSFENNGLLSFTHENGRKGGTLTLGNLGSAITNSGTICLKGVVYKQSGMVSGESGCISIGDEGLFWAYNGYQLTDQTIYLSSDSAALRLEALGSPTFVYKVVGFGKQKVGLAVAIREFQYDEDTGILTVSSLLITYKLDIGKGYDRTKFYVDDIDFGAGYITVLNGGIYYSGDVPTFEIPEASLSTLSRNSSLVH